MNNDKNSKLIYFWLASFILSIQIIYFIKIEIKKFLSFLKFFEIFLLLLPN